MAEASVEGSGDSLGVAHFTNNDLIQTRRTYYVTQEESR
jgi:hypothetical protein